MNGFMHCQNCHQRQATVPFIQIVDQGKVVTYLCKACAEEKCGGGHSRTLTVETVPGGGNQAHVETDTVCPACGETFAEFQKGGLLGCASCYQAFEPELTRLLKQIHGVSRHRTDPPDSPEAPEENMNFFEEQLRQAVAREAFEEAGLLRDRIAMLKAQNPDDS